MQHRLTDTEIDDLAARYQNGSTIDALAREFDAHRTTVMDHLERRGILRRTPRKLTDRLLAEAARHYTDGTSLAEIAEELREAPSTLARELRIAGVPIRCRGRPVAD